MPQANLSKRRRAARAPTAKRAPARVRTGGTTAPANLPRPRVALGAAQPARKKMGLGKAKSLTKPKTIGTESAPAFTPTIQQASGPPPESMSTAGKREKAWNDWNRLSGDYNHQLYLAALAYGDPDLVKQYGDVVPTPTGALQTVAREEEQAKRQTGIDRNQGNTFFSGFHLEDLKRLGDEAGFKRKSALDNWEKAKHDLMVAIQEAEQIRDDLLHEADVEDLQAFEETEPEPMEEPAPTSASSGGNAGNKGNTGKGKGTGKGKDNGKGTGTGGTSAPRSTAPNTGLGNNQPAKKRKR